MTVLAGITKFEEIGGVFIFALIVVILCSVWLFAKSQIKDMYRWWKEQKGTLGGGNSKRR